MTARRPPRKAFEQALSAALDAPAIAWRERAKVTGSPHFAALEVAQLFKGIMGRLPTFETTEEE